MGQSSNDVFPSAVHLAALDEATDRLLPALEQLEASLQAKADAFEDIVKSGRTHLMDAVPVTLGQEFGGYAAQIRLGAKRVRNALPQVAQIPLGGTATGTGLNTHPDFAAKVREKLSADTGLEIHPPEDPFEAQANRDALVELSGALKVVAVSLTKIANDLALMGSGPRAGIGEIYLPELQKGSSIMPGKVNPVMPGGRAPGRRAGDRQRHRDHDRRHAGPVRAQRAHPADRAQPAAVDRAALERVGRCWPRSASTASSPTRRACERSAEGTLAVATALNPFIGYDKAAEIVKAASESGGTLREVAREHGVDEETLDKALDLRKIAAGSKAERMSDLERRRRLAAVARARASSAPTARADRRRRRARRGGRRGPRDRRRARAGALAVIAALVAVICADSLPAHHLVRGRGARTPRRAASRAEPLARASRRRRAGSASRSCSRSAAARPRTAIALAVGSGGQPPAATAGARDLVAVVLARRAAASALVEHTRARRDDRALARGQRAELASRAAGGASSRRRTPRPASRSTAALGAQLALQRRPPQRERGDRVGVELAALAAAVVR